MGRLPKQRPAAARPTSPTPSRERAASIAGASERRAPNAAIALAIGAVAFAVYANSLSNGFVWDDPIILSRQLVVFRTWQDVVLTPRGIPQYSPDYYRPVSTATYLLDRALTGQNPFAYHLSVVVAHAATSVLLFLLGARLLAAKRFATNAAAVAALLFAVHPIHSESVAWSAGRSDVLATLFALAALLIHVGAVRPDWRRSVATGACVLLALGAKETAVAILPAIVLNDLALRAERSLARQLARLWSGPFAAVAVYVSLRRATIGDFVGSAPGEARIADAIGTVVGAVWVYATKLVWPVGLNAYIDTVPTGVVAWVLSSICIAGAAGGAVWAWSRGRTLLSFLIVWMGACLAPSLSIAWKIPDAPVAERYLYFPSAPFCLLFGYGLAEILSRGTRIIRRASYAVAAAILIACAIGTVMRNGVWHDDLRLWEDTSRKSQIAGMPLRSLATAYQSAGRKDEARRTFEAALERRNSPLGVLVIHNNLGTLEMLDGRLSDAERHYRKALELEADAPDALFNLGLVILESRGRTRAAAEEAFPYLSRALAISPFDPDVQAAVGQAKALLGDMPAAIEHLQRALELGLNPVSAKRVEALLSTLRARPAS